MTSARVKCFAAAILMSLHLTSGAIADTFLFSFTDPITNWTVGGQIILPGTGNYSGPALQVVLTTYPSAFDIAISELGANAVAWRGDVENTFTEINGQLDWSSSYFFGHSFQDCALFICGNDTILFQLGTLKIRLFAGPFELVALYSPPRPPGQLFVFSQDITVTPTPLPAALPLFATGLGALGLLGWRRKRKQAGEGVHDDKK